MKKLLLVFVLVIGAVFLYRSVARPSELKTAPLLPTEASVPLPSQEDIVRAFFNLVNEEKIPEAIAMMSRQAVGDESQKQAWGVQLAAFKSVNVKSVERHEDNTFKVDLEVEVDPEDVNLPIPYYGFENGLNVRWVTLVEEDSLFKILTIATGP